MRIINNKKELFPYILNIKKGRTKTTSITKLSGSHCTLYSTVLGQFIEKLIHR